MKFTAVVLGALAAVASALPAFTNTAFDVQENKPITLTWTGATGPVNIQILSGPNKDALVPVLTVATGLTGTSFTYTPSGLPSGNYAFKIVQPSTNEENYSVLFPYTGTGSSSSLVSSTRTTTGTSTRVTSSSSTSDASSTTSSAVSSSTSSTRSATTTATTTRSTPSTTPVNNNEGQRFGSSLALVFITVAALVFFN